MTNQTRKTAYRLFLGVFMLSFVAVACNSKKDKKETTTEDTIKVEPAPMPPDTAGMDKDTADTRPVKPGEKTDGGQ